MREPNTTTNLSLLKRLLIFGRSYKKSNKYVREKTLCWENNYIILICLSKINSLTQKLKKKINIIVYHRVEQLHEEPNVLVILLFEETDS
jgi:hypothetical protein